MNIFLLNFKISTIIHIRPLNMDWSIRAFLSPNKQTKHLLLILSPPVLLQLQASCTSDWNIFSWHTLNILSRSHCHSSPQHRLALSLCATTSSSPPSQHQNPKHEPVSNPSSLRRHNSGHDSGGGPLWLTVAHCGGPLCNLKQQQ